VLDLKGLPLEIILSMKDPSLRSLKEAEWFNNHRLKGLDTWIIIG
jgi:hypothetical protein